MNEKNNQPTTNNKNPTSTDMNELLEHLKHYFESTSEEQQKIDLHEFKHLVSLSEFFLHSKMDENEETYKKNFMQHLWNGKELMPTPYKAVLCISKKGFPYTCIPKDYEEWVRFCKLTNTERWCYTDDLLPKVE